MSKTDKELAVELTIASLEHYSSQKHQNGASSTRVTPIDIAKNYKVFENVISGKTNPLAKE